MKTYGTKVKFTLLYDALLVSVTGRLRGTLCGGHWSERPLSPAARS